MAFGSMQAGIVLCVISASALEFVDVVGGIDDVESAPGR